MILIDSLYVNYGGGKVLLDYLVHCIEDKKIEAYYLFDKRCEGSFDFISNDRKLFVEATLSNRRKFYLQNRNRFKTVLCFGNIPPPFKVNAVVYTYFHNINLLKIPSSSSFSTKINSFLKRTYISTKKHNTNYWIVQTKNTKKTLIHYLFETNEKVLILPFYKIDNINFQINKTDYVYISNYTKEKNHEFLIKAWIELKNRGYDKTLHLTISDIPNDLKVILQSAKSQGVSIVNHGYINKEDVYNLYLKSKAIVYPAVNESLGLCIIEALEFNCDVIGSNLPYIHAICKPSSCFELNNTESLINSIINYEKGLCGKSELLIKNNIVELLEILK